MSRGTRLSRSVPARIALFDNSASLAIVGVFDEITKIPLGEMVVFRLPMHGGAFSPYTAEGRIDYGSLAPGLIGSREWWSKNSAASPFPDFVFVAVAKSELCTQRYSRLGRRVRPRHGVSAGQRCEGAWIRIEALQLTPRAVP